MNDAGLAAELGASAVISMRDMLVLLGATDDELRNYDERREILYREPWRDRTRFVPLRPGSTVGSLEGDIDWSGTRFAPAALPEPPASPVE